jgi:hypothetical protein
VEVGSVGLPVAIVGQVLASRATDRRPLRGDNSR